MFFRAFHNLNLGRFLVYSEIILLENVKGAQSCKMSPIWQKYLWKNIKKVG